MTEREPGQTLDWTELIQVAWVACGAERDRMHRGWCKTRHVPYGPADPAGRGVHEECLRVGCLDLVHEVTAAAHQKLANPRSLDVADPHGYAHRTVSTLLIDRRRSGRVALGLPARPGRSDGKPALVVEAIIAAAGADTVEAVWFESLFRMMRDYAHRADRETTRWPVDGWAAEKSRHDGVPRPQSDKTRAEINRDVNGVLRIARDVLGAAWVHTAIYHPLAALLRPADASQLDASRSQAPEDVLLRNWLKEDYGRHRAQGVEPAVALGRAARKVLGVEPTVTPEITKILRDIDEDLGLAG